MNATSTISGTRMSVADVARAEVATYLYELFASEDGLLANLDRWTQRRITEENMAKLALVFEADDPAEACYRDLIREIDTEAEYGIYLASPDASSRHLRRVVDEPGVSGELGEQMDDIARTMFPDELAHSDKDFDLVWITIQARHDRAHVDAKVSMIIMDHISRDAEMTIDMVNAMRSMQSGDDGSPLQLWRLRNLGRGEPRADTARPTRGGGAGICRRLRPGTREHQEDVLVV